VNPRRRKLSLKASTIRNITPELAVRVKAGASKRGYDFGPKEPSEGVTCSCETSCNDTCGCESNPCVSDGGTCNIGCTDWFSCPADPNTCTCPLEGE